MPPRPGSQPSPRKFSPLKLEDSEIITRKDLQYDFLCHLFRDEHKVFTDPNASSNSPHNKVCFRDLYVNTILKSPRSSRFLRDKMTESPKFADDFSMISCLINVGRIPTNMAFFTEMKTSLRNYHPVPALSTTDGNLQDVPRIRLILKAAFLSNEINDTPSTPTEILARSASGRIPSTSVPNLLFVIANHSTAISEAFLPPESDFMDIFMPVAFSSASRAQALLWLCYHYLEANHQSQDDAYKNPFAEDERDPRKMPSLIALTPEQFRLENVEPEEDKVLARRLLGQRREFLATQELSSAKEASGSSKLVQPSLTIKRKRPSASSDTRFMGPEHQGKIELVDTTLLASGLRASASGNGAFGPEDSRQSSGVSRSAQPLRQSGSTSRNQPRIFRPNYGEASDWPPQPSSHTSHQHVPSDHNSLYVEPNSNLSLQHAFHVATQADPLVESDEEKFDAQQLRRDYTQRLAVLTRLRGRPPTPES